MMPNKQEVTNFFTKVPKELVEEVKEHLHRLDGTRAGSIWPSQFEDGMRYVLLQMLALHDGTSYKRLKEIVEGYSKLRALDFERRNIIYDFRKKHEEEANERLQSSTEKETP